MRFNVPRFAMSHDLTDGLLWYIVFLYSTVFHEAAHAWTALKLGDDTAYRGGQVSFDPLPHIRREPMGMVVVPLISFLSAGWMLGWASAPYNPQWALQYPRRSALMALAGPGANLAVVIVTGLLLRMGIEWHVWQEPFGFSPAHLVLPMAGGLWPWASELLSIAFSLNLLLAVFNLLPLPPLDGSSLPLLFLHGTAAQSYANAMRSPGLRLVGLVVAWQGFRYIFDPVRRIVTEVLYPGAR
jgi:Zn-dependent protease